MSCSRFVQAVAITCLALGATTSVKASYSVVILHPEGHLHSYGTGIANGQAVGYSLPGADTGFHGLLWSLSTPNVRTDLTPPGVGAHAIATDGLQQVGLLFTSSPSGSTNHAALWTGSAASLVDLHADPYTLTVARGVGGGQQVGSGLTPTTGSHALLWTGTPESMVNLHPPGYSTTVARGTNGTHQVGRGVTNSGDIHALLWSGTAESVVNLNPPATLGAFAYAISGTQIVGRTTVAAGVGHAAIWSDLGSVFSDVNPPGYGDSALFATSGTYQAGHADGHAMVWRGSADSVVDLHLLLPSGYRFSQANGVDEFGNVIGEAFHAPSGEHHAVLWLIPEPCTPLVLLGYLPFVVRRGRR